MLIIDIETGPLPDDELRSVYIEPTYEEFAAGCDQRWKEETKREKYESGRESRWQQFVDRAALSPLTGRVLAIGFRAVGDSGKCGILGAEQTEAELLTAFWQKYRECRKQSPARKLCGWNILGFDLPFLIRRSWKLGVEIPATIRDGNDRYWDTMLIDLMQRFAVGAWKENTKLDVAARFFGVGSKPDGVSGADFARLWLGTAAERQQACDYLKNDLAMTAGIAERMGIV